MGLWSYDERVFVHPGKPSISLITHEGNDVMR